MCQGCAGGSGHQGPRWELETPSGPQQEMVGRTWALPSSPLLAVRSGVSRLTFLKSVEWRQETVMGTTPGSGS